MSAWGGGNPGSGSNFGGNDQSPFNPDSAMLGRTNPAAAGVGGSTGGGGGTLSVPQTPFAGGMQRPMGDAQPMQQQPPPQGPPQMGNWGNRQPQSMARPMGMGGGGMQRPMPMSQPPMGYRPGMAQQGGLMNGIQPPMGQPPPQQNGMPMPPSSILARMRSGGGMSGPPSTGGPQPGMSNTRLAPPPQGPPMGGPPMGPPPAPPQVMQPPPQPDQQFQAGPGGPQTPQAAPPPMQQPSNDPATNSMLQNSNNALRSQVFGG